VTAAPGVVRSGEPTAVVVTARSTASQMSSPPLAVPVFDGTAAPPVTLNDDGVDGDLVAGDGVYAATVPVVATGTAHMELVAGIDGSPVDGVVQIDVVPAGAPTTSMGATAAPTISCSGSTAEYATDRIIVRFSDGSGWAEVSAAAAAIGGEPAGRISSTSWQVQITPLSDCGEFSVVADLVSTMPGVIGVDLEELIELESVVPNDPRFDQQWHHEVMGNPEAWILNRGSGGVLAVIDSGIDLEHDDLRSVEGINLIDGGDDVSDVRCGHGTHVAGIAGAVTNNGTAVAGTSWGLQIMPIKVFRDNPPEDDQACSRAPRGSVAEGIQWAVDRGASIINLSLSGTTRDEDVVRALDSAWNNDVVVVAAAGNCGVDTPVFPAGYERRERFTSWFGTFPRTYTTDVISVGSTDQDDNRSTWTSDGCPDPLNAGSNFGDWVDLSAPGTAIRSTIPVNGNGNLGGTSMATPNVAGVVDLIRSQEPELTVDMVKRRLVSTGFDIGDQQIGPRVDSLAATFNGGFEAGLDTWQTTGDARAVRRLGQIRPREGRRMALISTGPGSASTRATLGKTLEVDASLIDADELTLSFRYNYVSSEFPHYVESIFNDQFRAVVRLPSGTELVVVQEEVNTTAWTPVTGITLPSGDGTVGQSGWRTASVTIDVADLDGENSLEFEVFDVGDDIFDSLALIDDVRLS